MVIASPQRYTFAMSAKDTFHTEEKDFRHILSAFQARLLFYDPLEKEALEWIEPTSFA